jgi:regulator of nonsense transcripts 2
MESAPNGAHHTKTDEERTKLLKRAKLKEANDSPHESESNKMDSSLKRHTALIKRMRQSMAADYRDQIMKDIDTLTLEKYMDEISSAAMEGIARCKTDKDVWTAVEIICAVHQRFPGTFTTTMVGLLRSSLSAPDKAALAAMSTEQREKEETARIIRQRPTLRVCAELALVGVIRDAPGRSGGEWMIKVLRELLSNDPTLASLPLLSTFLKYFSRPYLGINPPSSSKEAAAEGTKAEKEVNGNFPALSNEEEELVEQDIRDRFKRMCEGYFDNVCKKLLIEHKVKHRQGTLLIVPPRCP